MKTHMIDLGKIMDRIVALQEAEPDLPASLETVQRATQDTHPGVGDIPVVVLKEIVLAMMHAMAGANDFTREVHAAAGEELLPSSMTIPPGVTIQ